METDSNYQLLQRIASLVSENKTLKEKYRNVLEINSVLSCELDKYKDLLDNNAKHSVYKKVRFEIVTIMFVNIIGLSDVVKDDDNSSKYMDKLDEFLLFFNDIVKKYNLVKIHSIGDSYACAGGIPVKDVVNPVTVIIAAFEMLSVLENALNNNEDSVWNLKIGIHTGSVTTLVNKDKSAESSHYELKGDTMNDASRIVSVGKKGKIIISETTYELVKELFDCHYFSSLPVKYRNKFGLYLVSGFKERYATDESRYLPNLEFRTRLMLIQFGDLQELILDKLEKELPEHLYYHNVKHTVDVVTQCELIGWSEGLNDHQLLMLKTAALFHDTGHTISYADHEERSSEIARAILPKYKYIEEEIEEICRIIMATKMPPKPIDLLESIICDSDLDYLGRIDFLPVSNTLYNELKTHNPALTLNEWNKMQVKFISSHQYFTKTGRKLRNVKKQEQIERIKNLIEEE